MNKFEDKREEGDLIKNSQKKEELLGEEGIDAKKETSQEEIDKTLMEISESVEDVKKTLDEVKLIEGELDKSPEELEKIRARYQEEIGEIELKHGKAIAILFGIAGASFVATVAGQESIEFFCGSIADRAGTIAYMAASVATMFTMVRMQIKTAILDRKKNEEIYQ